MHTIRPCGCKGVRTCLKCEAEYEIKKPNLKQELKKLDVWSYCVACEKFYAGWDVEKTRQEHPQHKFEAQSTEVPGILVQEHFISPTEAEELVQRLDAMPWTVSQSGRRKQNFGPRTNFKKRKLQVGTFNGFPIGTQFVQEKLSAVPLLQGFQTIEQCSLEYDALKGASIDPHIDDCWVWGERVVTVNCLGDAVLTLTPYEEVACNNRDKYNLNLVAKYKPKLLLPLATDLTSYRSRVFRIPMPNCSLMVLYGPARYQFEHCVLREDVQTRRVCLAYREFTPIYLEDGEEANVGSQVIEKAKTFFPDKEYAII